VQQPPVSHSTSLHTRIIGVTVGDPAGIGPEVSLRAFVHPSMLSECSILLFGDLELLRSQARNLGLPFDYEGIPVQLLSGKRPLAHRGVVHVDAGRALIEPGKGSKASGEAAARAVIACARACMNGSLDAMVTAPLNKTFLRAAGYPFPGHTEFLAHLSGAEDVAMAFLSERLKVVLVTIHVALRTAIDQITPEAILCKLRIILNEFPRLGLACSRIGVAGINPHAGESGLLGDDERERVEPALDEARRLWPRVHIAGPLPADTLCYRAAQGEFDVVLAHFHDQGLAPIKMIGFGEAVNVTLGLPFIRTSVDHGTAYEIAGKGMARPDGMLTAIRWALRLQRP